MQVSTWEPARRRPARSAWARLAPWGLAWLAVAGCQPERLTRSELLAAATKAEVANTTTDADTETDAGVAPADAAQADAADGQGATAAEMVRLPAGTYRQGATALDQATGQHSQDELPQHEVTLQAFDLDRHEVTVSRYAECVQTGSCTAPKTSAVVTECNWGRPGRDQHPINCVSWHQASAFCQWAGKRLPTEAEWEYAARSGDGSSSPPPFPWGAEPPTCALAVFKDAAGGCGATTSPVCATPAGNSAQGACDLAGNVWEWVADWYGAYPAGPLQDPTGPTTGSERVARGGAMSTPPEGLRAALRATADPAKQYSDFGFRCARSL